MNSDRVTSLPRKTPWDIDLPRATISGQIVTFHQSRFPWKRKITGTSANFWGETKSDCEVRYNGITIIWRRLFRTIVCWVEQFELYKVVALSQISPKVTCPTWHLPQLVIPKCSMGREYLIFTYIWLKFMVTVGKYSIHGAYGNTTYLSLQKQK